MREIKFRVWNKKTKSWVHGPNEEVNLFGEMILVGGFMYKITLDDLNECIALQYSELKDKNGKEIYEGDILKFMGRWDEKGNVLTPDYEPYEVLWFMGGLHAFKISRKTYLSYHEHNDCLGVSHTDCEVIGNIYENPLKE